MTKRLLISCCTFFMAAVSFAQSKDEIKYKERAAEIKQEITSGSDAAFQVKEVPEKYKNESAVIIARSFEVTNSAKRKFKMKTIFGGSVKQYSYFTTIHERVSIKDKSALEDYSTLNYKKVIDNSTRGSFVKYLNTSMTYVGATIVKQDGKTISIDVSQEEVLTKNEDKNKEGKIAIPDLQVGDILDYYIRIEELQEDIAELRGPDLFYLADEYPILYYNVKYVLNQECGVDYMSANGAKEIEQSRNEDRDIVLEFTEKDLPKVSSVLWTSQTRQLPYYIIRYGFPAKMTPGISMFAPAGGVRVGPFSFQYKNKLRDMFKSYGMSGVSTAAIAALEDHFGGKKAAKALPVDSIVNFLYNYTKWANYYDRDQMEVENDRNYNNMSWLLHTVTLSELLHKFEIENDIIFVGNRNGKKLENAFSLEDIHTFVRVNSGAKFTWLCFNDYFQTPDKLAAVYQGENAIKMSRLLKGVWPNYGIAEDIQLPVAPAEENLLKEELKVSFNKDNLQLITIEKTTTETGAMKQGDQKRLMLSEDVDAEFSRITGKRTISEILADSRKTKGKAAEMQAAFDQERKKQKDYFNSDIKDQYDQDPLELKSFKILNNGLTAESSDFRYEQVFTMDNFVKKAGNNYIVDAGRLMGTYKKTEEKDRNRTLDIYMPCARQLNYIFKIEIPEGYTAQGLEAFAKKIDNKSASFSSTAVQDGNAVIISVNRTYKTNFEPAANWPDVLAIMDAAADFTGLKLLLQKKK